MSDPLSASMNKTLLLDIGNTRMKYAYHDPNHKMVATYCQHIEEIEELQIGVKKVVLGSVKTNELTQQTVAACQQRGITVVQVNTQPEAFGITCAYKAYQNLGVDRWLAVLAARLHTDLPVAVIDAGTAITCDLVVGNRHIGGWIAPGFEMMRNTVTAKADRVFGDTSRPRELRLGTSTEECVNMGCLAALRGALLEAQRILISYGDDYRIFLCGGDSDLLVSLSSEQVVIKPNLVLEGLGRYS